MADPLNPRELTAEEENQIEQQILTPAIEQVDVEKIRAIVDILRKPGASFLQTYTELEDYLNESFASKGETRINDLTDQKEKTALNDRIRLVVLKAVKDNKPKINDRIKKLEEGFNGEAERLYRQYDLHENKPKREQYLAILERQRPNPNVDVSKQTLKEEFLRIQKQETTRWVAEKMMPEKIKLDDKIAALKSLLKLLGTDIPSDLKSGIYAPPKPPQPTDAEQQAIAEKAATEAEEKRIREMRTDFTKIQSPEDYRVYKERWEQVSAFPGIYSRPTGDESKLYRMETPAGGGEPRFSEIKDRKEIDEWKKFKTECEKNEKDIRNFFFQYAHTQYFLKLERYPDVNHDALKEKTVKEIAAALIQYYNASSWKKSFIFERYHISHQDELTDAVRNELTKIVDEKYSPDQIRKRRNEAIYKDFNEIESLEDYKVYMERWRSVSASQVHPRPPTEFDTTLYREEALAGGGVEWRKIENQNELHQWHNFRVEREQNEKTIQGTFDAGLNKFFTTMSQLTSAPGFEPKHFEDSLDIASEFIAEELLDIGRQDPWKKFHLFEIYEVSSPMELFEKIKEKITAEEHRRNNEEAQRQANASTPEVQKSLREKELVADFTKAKNPAELRWCADYWANSSASKLHHAKPQHGATEAYFFEDREPLAKAGAALTQPQLDQMNDFFDFIENGEIQLAGDFQNAILRAVDAIEAELGKPQQSPKTLPDLKKEEAEFVTAGMLSQNALPHERARLFLQFDVGNEREFFDKVALIIEQQLISAQRKGKEIFREKRKADGKVETKKMSKYLEEHGDFGEVMVELTNENLVALYEMHQESFGLSFADFRDVLIHVIKTRGGKEIDKAGLRLSLADTKRLYGTFLSIKPTALSEDQMLALLIAFKEQPPQVYNLEMVEGVGWKVIPGSQKKGEEVLGDFHTDSIMYQRVRESLRNGKGQEVKTKEFNIFIGKVAPKFAKLRSVIMSEVEKSPDTPLTDDQKVAILAGGQKFISDLTPEDVQLFLQLMESNSLDRIEQVYKYSLYSGVDRDVPIIEALQGPNDKVALKVALVDVEAKFEFIADRLARKRLAQEMGSIKWYGFAKKWVMRNAEEAYLQKFKDEYMKRLKDPAGRKAEFMNITTGAPAGNKTPKVGETYTLDDELNAIVEVLGDSVVEDSYLTAQERAEFKEQEEHQLEIRQICEKYVAARRAGTPQATAEKDFTDEMHALATSIGHHTKREMKFYLSDSDATKDLENKTGLLDQLNAHVDGLINLDIENLKAYVGKARNVDVQTGVNSNSWGDRWSRAIIEKLQKNRVVGSIASPFTIAAAGFVIRNIVTGVGTQKLATKTLALATVSSLAPFSAAVVLVAAGCLAGGVLSGLRETKEIKSLKRQAEANDTLGTGATGHDVTKFEEELKKTLYKKKPVGTLMNDITKQRNPDPLREALAEALARYELSGFRGDAKNHVSDVSLIQYDEASREQQMLELVRVIKQGKNKLVEMVQAATPTTSEADILKRLDQSTSHAKETLNKEIAHSEELFDAMKKKKSVRAGMTAGAIGLATAILPGVLIHGVGEIFNGAKIFNDYIVGTPIVGNRKKTLGQGNHKGTAGSGGGHGGGGSHGGAGHGTGGHGGAPHGVPHTPPPPGGGPTPPAPRTPTPRSPRPPRAPTPAPGATSVPPAVAPSIPPSSPRPLLRVVTGGRSSSSASVPTAAPATPRLINPFTFPKDKIPDLPDLTDPSDIPEDKLPDFLSAYGISAGKLGEIKKFIDDDSTQIPLGKAGKVYFLRIFLEFAVKHSIETAVTPPPKNFDVHKNDMPTSMSRNEPDVSLIAQFYNENIVFCDRFNNIKKGSGEVIYEDLQKMLEFVRVLKG